MLMSFVIFFCIALQDMGIEEKEIIELVSQIEGLEKKLFSHPMHKVCTIDQFMFLNAMLCR